MQTVYDEAMATGLFAQSVVKVRVLPFTDYIVDGSTSEFLHIYAHIMQGRTEYQKKDLADRIMRSLKLKLPDTPVLSINIDEFNKGSYSNRDLV